MKKKQLGRTDILVSEIAFGGVEIGIPYGIGVHSEANMLTKQDAVRLLHQAFDQGISFFDTARSYGESERLMGLAFKDSRQQVVLASKCRHLRQADGQLINRANLENYIRASLQESLQSLQTDYVDLYMVHYADKELLNNDEISRIFVDLKQEGLVRAIGVSVYKPEETGLAVAARIWDAIQLPFNLMDQCHGQFFEQAYKTGVAIIVRSVLMRGMLTDRMQKLHPALHAVEQHIYSYRKLLDGKFNSLPQFATRFALSHDAVSSVLVGIDKQQYLDEAIASASGSRFDEDLLRQVQSMGYPQPGFLNLAEWDKNGWL